MSFSLIDGPSALIVVGGALGATLLRCGWGECRQAALSLLAACRPGFDPDTARADLVAQVRAIREDGVIRARPRRTGDREFDEATDALIHRRSVDALLAAHRRHKAQRLAEADSAVRVLAQAAELAPVFGMAGTLIALNQMAQAPLDDAGGAITAAVGSAVVTTLYGILLANLVLAPLARLVDRAARREDQGREAVAEWLAAQVAEAVPHLRSAAHPSGHPAAPARPKPLSDPADPAEAA